MRTPRGGSSLRMRRVEVEATRPDATEARESQSASRAEVAQTGWTRGARSGSLAPLAHRNEREPGEVGSIEISATLATRKARRDQRAIERRFRDGADSVNSLPQPCAAAVEGAGGKPTERIRAASTPSTGTRHDGTSGAPSRDSPLLVRARRTEVAAPERQAGDVATAAR